MTDITTTIDGTEYYANPTDIHIEGEFYDGGFQHAFGYESIEAFDLREIEISKIYRSDDDEEITDAELIARFVQEVREHDAIEELYWERQMEALA